MCPMTNPKSTSPVAAITTFFPMDDPKKVAARCMLSPGMVDAVGASTRRSRRDYMPRQKRGARQDGSSSSGVVRRWEADACRGGAEPPGSAGHATLPILPILDGVAGARRPCGLEAPCTYWPPVHRSRQARCCSWALGAHAAVAWRPRTDSRRRARSKRRRFLSPANRAHPSSRARHLKASALRLRPALHQTVRPSRARVCAGSHAGTSVASGSKRPHGRRTRTTRNRRSQDQPEGGACPSSSGSCC